MSLKYQLTSLDNIKDLMDHGYFYNIKKNNRNDFRESLHYLWMEATESMEHYKTIIINNKCL